MSQFRLTSILVVAALGFGSAIPAVADVAVARTTYGRLVVRHAARSLLVESYSARKTLQATSLRELSKKAAPVAADAWARYGGNFKQYWKASNQTNQRVGKVFEAVVVWRMNQELAKSGSSSRVLVTAVEGYPSSPTDLVEVLPNGQVKTKFQLKHGSMKTVKDAYAELSKPKYEGHLLVTTQESLEKLEKQLRKAEASARSRGVPLYREAQAVRDALDDGRIPRSLAGKPLPTQSEVFREGFKSTKEQFRATATYGARKPVQGRVVKVLKYVGPAFQKTLIVVEVVAIGYTQYRDTMRYARGDIAAEYFVVKTGLRGASLALVVYGVVSPEPVTKTAALVAAGVIITAEIVADVFQERADARREEAVRDILERIDRHERYLAVRAKLRGVRHGSAYTPEFPAVRPQTPDSSTSPQPVNN